jgi:hypothetical protein
VVSSVDERGSSDGDGGTAVDFSSLTALLAKS